MMLPGEGTPARAVVPLPEPLCKRYPANCGKTGQ